MLKLIERYIRAIATAALPGEEKMATVISYAAAEIMEHADDMLDLPEPLETLSDAALSAVTRAVTSLVARAAQELFDRIKSQDPLVVKLHRRDVGTLNLSLAELERSGVASEQGIDNHVPDEMLFSAQATMDQGQIIRNVVGPVSVSSGFRARRVQEIVYADQIAKLPRKDGKLTAAGKKKLAKIMDTQHSKAQALDLFSRRRTRAYLLDVIQKLQRAGGLDLDQIIIYEWGSKLKQRIVHISHKAEGDNRGEFLISKAPGKYDLVPGWAS